MDFIQKFISGTMDQISGGVRKFVAFAMIMFFLGAVYGFALPLVVERTAIPEGYLVLVPLVLALLAYLSSEVAFILFLCMLGLVFLIFL